MCVRERDESQRITKEKKEKSEWTRKESTGRKTRTDEWTTLHWFDRSCKTKLIKQLWKLGKLTTTTTTTTTAQQDKFYSFSQNKFFSYQQNFWIESTFIFYFPQLAPDGDDAGGLFYFFPPSFPIQEMPEYVQLQVPRYVSRSLWAIDHFCNPPNLYKYLIGNTLHSTGQYLWRMQSRWEKGLTVCVGSYQLKGSHLVVNSSSVTSSETLWNISHYSTAGAASLLYLFYDAHSILLLLLREFIIIIVVDRLLLLRCCICTWWLACAVSFISKCFSFLSAGLDVRIDE